MLLGLDEFQKMTVCKSIELMNISNQLSLLELRLLDVYLARINPENATQKDVVFSIKEYNNFFCLKQTRRDDIERALFNLSNIKYTIIDTKTKEEKRIRLFSYADFQYIEEVETDCICLYCSDEVSKYMFNRKPYFKYNIKDIVKLSYNDYLFYLYFQLKKEFGAWKVTTKELKEFIVGSDEKYREFSNFEKILKSALKLFKQITDIEIKYIKERRYNRIYKLEFLRNYEYEDNINKNKKNKKKKDTKKEEVIETKIESIIENSINKEYELVEIKEDDLHLYNSFEQIEIEECNDDEESIIEYIRKYEEEIFNKVVARFDEKLYVIVHEDDCWAGYNKYEVLLEKRRKETYEKINEDSLRTITNEEYRIDLNSISFEKNDNKDDENDDWLPFS